MNTINITTSQNIDVEYDLASLGERLLGYIIDYIIIIAYVVLFLVIANFDSIINDNYWIIVLFIAPVFFYDLACETWLNGQSAGKRIMGTKVISLNGAQPSFGQYLIRWLFRLLDFSFSWYLLGFIMVAVSQKKQRLGDLIAGTVVVKTKPRTQMFHTIYEAVNENNYQVTYPEVINLSDNDVRLIREILITVNETGNTMLALQAQQKIEQILSIMSRHPEPRQFLQVVMADYNHLTAAL